MENEQTVTPEEELEQTPETTEETQQEAVEEAVETNPFEEKYNAEHDSLLRLAAEYDNFRKRTIKEKEASYGNGKADAVAKILPVYDNLERALKQETADEAFKKGVEMTMTQLKTVLEKLGITEIPALGQTIDPNLHNAVMHVEDEEAGENTIVEEFQKGYTYKGTVVRYSMVKVAN